MLEFLGSLNLLQWFVSAGVLGIIGIAIDKVLKQVWVTLLPKQAIISLFKTLNKYTNALAKKKPGLAKQIESDIITLADELKRIIKT